MQAIHAELARRHPGLTLDRLPVFQHREDHELGYPPLYERLSIQVAPAGFPAWCSSNREGDALEGIFAAHHDARHPAGPHSLVFDPDDRAVLRSHGWRGTSTWSARWSADQPARVAAAFTALAALSPRVLLPADLPQGAPWPWADFVFSVLLAELESVEGTGERRILRTRTDGEPHRVLVPEGSPWDALWRGWLAHPPELRPYAQWRRA